MSVQTQIWKNETNYRNDRSTIETPLSTPRSISPVSRGGEDIYYKYLDIIHSKTNITTEEKQQEHQDRPFDFFDDEEFAFGINLLNNNVACVGDNMTKLIQMAQEPWPENVKLFQPYEVEQILLPDNASCLAVQAFLKMCNLPFEVEMRWNAEFMSPSGRVPFIKCGAFVVSELEPIVQFAANKGVTLCSRLSTEEKAEMRAYMSLITNVLVNAELYISWLDNDTFNAVTKVRNSSVYPWPLGWLQTRSKRNAVAKRLKALHWHDKTLDQVLADVEQCCNSLSQRLGDRDYFFGTTPTPLDALVYGHIRALLSATGPKVALLIKPITSPLLKHVVRVAGATRMKLTAQEEYLITQAFQVTKRRLSSPDRSISDRSTRARKSRLCCKNSSKDDNIYGKDVFGFKPFASKQIIIMISKEGLLTCAYEYPYKHPNFTLRNEETYDLVTEILEDVIDKVEELAFHEFTKKIDKERNDFEIVYPSDFTNVVIKIDDYLGTIDETDMSMSRIDEQSNGVASERNLEVKTSESPRKFESDFTDSSNIIKESYLTVCSSGDKINKMSDKTELPKTPLSTGSKSTLKLSPNDEISVESLLKYLRERNSSFTNLLQVADVDFD